MKDAPLEMIELSSNGADRPPSAKNTNRNAALQLSAAAAETEVCRLTKELEQIEADRAALFVSSPPPLLENRAQSRRFFKELNAITARYIALERQCRQAQMVARDVRRGLKLVPPQIR